MWRFHAGTVEGVVGVEAERGIVQFCGEGLRAVRDSGARRVSEGVLRVESMLDDAQSFERLSTTSISP